MTTDATFLLLGGGKIEHSIFHFFVCLTFAAAKVQQICDIRKKKLIFGSILGSLGSQKKSQPFRVTIYYL